MDNKKNDNYILYPVKKFIEMYKESKKVRLHMPGHKGAFGYEDDITEVHGADSLYEASGIIAESEKRTAELFGAESTFYSTEGSSQVIKAMCFLAMQRWHERNGVRTDDKDVSVKTGEERPVILATRNAHKSFIYADMLLCFDIKWMYPEREDYSLCKCELTPEELDDYIKEIVNENAGKVGIAAVYVTSPDYLGNILDIEGLATVAHKYDIPLLVDNAHGAYLKFVKNNNDNYSKKDLHPITLGTDMCADSAHKTLPVLTGGAYLHVSEKSLLKNGKDEFEEEVRKALLMFGSTSPSYMIMESLDEALNRIKTADYLKTEKRVAELENKLSSIGYKLLNDNEPLKIVVDLRGLSISGNELSDKLRKKGIECEYADPDFLVTMWSPFNEYPKDYEKFKDAMSELWDELDCSAEVRAGSSFNGIVIKDYKLPEVKYQPYEVKFLSHKKAKVDDSLIGKVVADTSVSCPPAVSPIVAGEIIDKNILLVLKYYGIIDIEVLG